MTASQIQQIELEKITWPSQVRDRYDDKDVIAMALSMKAVGQLYAILVQWVNDGWIGIDGGTRWLAAKKLGWKTIAAIASDGELCEGDFVHRQLSSTVRTDFKPLEKARAIVRLKELTGWSATEVAARLGMSNGALSRLLAVLSLPEPIAQRVNLGEISVSMGYELSKIANPAKQSEMARDAANGRLTRDGASEVAKQEKNGNSSQSKREGSRTTISLGDGRSVTVTGATSSIDSVVEVLEELLGKLRKARNSGIELPSLIKMLREQSQPHAVEA